MSSDESDGASNKVQSTGRASEQHSSTMVELQHRVRNLLAVVRSIARRTAESSRTIEEFSMNFDGRLNAYARTLSLLVRDPKNGVELEYLVAEELLAAQAHDGDNVRISGPAMRLQPRAAETIGLAVHELATNSIKHGALGHAEGKVDISWRVDRNPSGESLVFDWVESGARRLMPVPTRRGFGVVMLEETLAFELGAGASLHFESTGFRCSILFPVSDQVFVLHPSH
jgi:two-component system CheB/CheR fusion protein